MAVYHILGVMSGSSLDGIDMAIVQFHVHENLVHEWHCLKTGGTSLSDEWKSRLESLATQPPGVFFQTDAEFGKFLGTACSQFIHTCGIRPDIIASHGHTVLHSPAEGYSVQIGSAAQIAKLTGCHVVTDFRSSDIAAGGQGAPLAPLAEKILFPGYAYYLNLGGIANLSFFSDTKGPVAWDISPCNQLLNYLANGIGLPFDDGGSMAASGQVHAGLLAALQQPLPLPLRKPLALDNTWVRQQYLPVLSRFDCSPADKLASVTEYIARSVEAQIGDTGNAVEKGSLFITGGGAHNVHLVKRIRASVAPVNIHIPDREIVDYKESILMGLCGLHRLLRLPNALGSVTGAAYDTINGQLTVAHTPAATIGK